MVEENEVKITELKLKLLAKTKEGADWTEVRLLPKGRPQQTRPELSSLWKTMSKLSAANATILQSVAKQHSGNPKLMAKVKDQRKKAFGKLVKKASGDVESSSDSDDQFISQAFKPVSHASCKESRIGKQSRTVLIRIGESMKVWSQIVVLALISWTSTNLEPFVADEGN